MARDSKALSGWKGGSGEEWTRNSSDWCENLQPGESVEECIETHTFSREDVLKDILWGFDPNNSILTEGLVSEDFTMDWQGKFFSFEVPRTMVSDDDGKISTRLSLVLGFNMTFQIFLHDPNFFEMNYRPIFPVILKSFNPEKDYSQFYNLIMTEVRNFLLDNTTYFLPC